MSGLSWQLDETSEDAVKATAPLHIPHIPEIVCAQIVFERSITHVAFLLGDEMDYRSARHAYALDNATHEALVRNGMFEHYIRKEDADTILLRFAKEVVTAYAHLDAWSGALRSTFDSPP